MIFIENEKVMKNLMNVFFRSGIYFDEVKISIINNGKEIFSKEYRYGFDASATRRAERYAREDHENSIKYNWENSYPLKPFIGDILKDIKSEYNILTEEQIMYAGFRGEDLSSDYVKQKFKFYTGE